MGNDGNLGCSINNGNINPRKKKKELKDEVVLLPKLKRVFTTNNWTILVIGPWLITDENEIIIIKV